ncbi:DNA replication and repair protein RecF [uncultured archaeon]|nr:DNA replication and repair protein RecF [uncultured archaeon]
MKIEKLHIENYKSIKNIDLRLNGNFNILIGKNNVGKSNIIDSLMFISEIITEMDIERVLNSWGGYEQIVFGSDNKKRIAFDLEISLSYDDKKSLFYKLSLQDVSFEEFDKDISNRIKYRIELSNKVRASLDKEEIFIYIREKEILYANGSWEKSGMYMLNAIQNFGECYKEGSCNFVSLGGGSPSNSIISSQRGRWPTNPEYELLLMLYNFFRVFEKLNPIRESPGGGSARGDFRLQSNAKNLPQTLNTLASSKRKIFEKINQSVRELIGGIIEVRAPLKEGTQDVFLSITEEPFGNTEFMWKHISSGTKEIIYLITLLHSTPKGSLLAIEELESHLHGDAISKFMSIINEVSINDDKQFILTTHSPVLIDSMPFDKLFVVIKEAGETKTVELKDFTNIDEILEKAGVPKSWILHNRNPSFIFLIEGKDDFEIWKQFFIKKGMNIQKQKIITCGNENGGGFDKLIETGKFLKKIRLQIPFMIVADSDNKKEEKEKKLKKDFSSEEFHILLKKEIEDYIIEPEAISKLTNKTIGEVEAAIKNSKSNGKEKLDSIFLKLGMSKPVSQIKALLVNHMEEIPEEILQIMSKVDERT